MSLSCRSSPRADDPKSLGLRTGDREMASRTWSMCCCNKVDGLMGVLLVRPRRQDITFIRNAQNCRSRRDDIGRIRLLYSASIHRRPSHSPYPVRRQPNVAVAVGLFSGLSTREPPL